MPQKENPDFTELVRDFRGYREGYIADLVARDRAHALAVLTTRDPHEHHVEYRSGKRFTAMGALRIAFLTAECRIRIPIVFSGSHLNNAWILDPRAVIRDRFRLIAYDGSMLTEDQLMTFGEAWDNGARPVSRPR